MIIVPTVPARSIVASGGGELRSVPQRLILPIDIDGSYSSLYDDQKSDLQRAELPTDIRRDYHAAAAAQIPMVATPELFSALPTGAEQSKPIVPSSSGAATAAAPALLLPPPTSDDTAAVTALTPAAPETWLGPAASSAPDGFVPPSGGDSYAPPSGGAAAAMVPSGPGWPAPTPPMAMQLVPAARTPWVPIGIGIAMAGVGIYLLTKKKRGR